jgi:hypothetical protein
MKIAKHKHTVQFKQNQTTQTTKKGYFNLLDFLRYCNKRDMAKGLWIARYEFESLAGKVKMIGENWTKQDIIDEVLCFTKA